MLPYDTEKQARAIFRRLVAQTLTRNADCTDAQADVLAGDALLAAQEFSRALGEEAKDSGLKTDIRIPEAVAHCRKTFEDVTAEWLREKVSEHPPKLRRDYLHRFQRYLFPAIGAMPISKIKAPDLVPALRAIEDAGLFFTAHRTLKDARRVFNFAMAYGYTLHDPTAGAGSTLFRHTYSRRATILLPSRIGELLCAIDAYRPGTVPGYFLRLMPFVFVRNSELRYAEWSEINFPKGEWRVPARKMKSPRPHIVPLSRQAKKLLCRVYRMTGSGRYVFPGTRSKDGVLSSPYCSLMMRDIGFEGEMTLSGFRSMAATLLSEQGWSAGAIERQLAHQDPLPIRRVYNFAEYLPERIEMMQAWADYLDELRAKPRR